MKTYCHFVSVQWLHCPKRPLKQIQSAPSYLFSQHQQERIWKPSNFGGSQSFSSSSVVIKCWKLSLTEQTLWLNSQTWRVFARSSRHYVPRANVASAESSVSGWKNVFTCKTHCGWLTFFFVTLILWEFLCFFVSLCICPLTLKTKTETYFLLPEIQAATNQTNRSTDIINMAKLESQNKK